MAQTPSTVKSPDTTPEPQSMTNPRRRRRAAAATALAGLVVAACGDTQTTVPVPAVPAAGASVDAGGDTAASERPAVDDATPAARPEPPEVPRLRSLGGITLPGGRDMLGGLSAMEVSPDGSTLTAIGDRGWVFTIALRYGADNGLVEAAVTGVTPVLEPDGTPVSGLRADAEGLARLSNGGYALSFEREHRIAVYPAGPGDTGALGLLVPPRGTELSSNRGIEALTALPDGRLLAIAETALDVDAGRHQAWLVDDRGWSDLVYQAEPGFRPSGATTLPSGDVVVIERRTPRLLTLGGRLVFIPATALRPGTTVSGVEIGRLGPPLTNDNYEAVAAWRDADGRTRLLVASDDNYTALLRTRLEQFVFEPSPTATSGLTAGSGS